MSFTCCFTLCLRELYLLRFTLLAYESFTCYVSPCLLNRSLSTTFYLAYFKKKTVFLSFWNIRLTWDIPMFVIQFPIVSTISKTRRRIRMQRRIHFRKINCMNVQYNYFCKKKNTSQIGKYIYIYIHTLIYTYTVISSVDSNILSHIHIHTLSLTLITN